MKRLAIAVSILTLAAMAAASGCKKGVGGTCTKESDCAKGEECIFTAPGCTAPRGTCQRQFTTLCKHASPYCTCDDRTETACDPRSPFKDHGPCEGDRADGRPCTKAADCGPHAAECLFEPGCDAPHGTCKSVDRLNHCKVEPPYCACTGETHTACEVSEPYRNHGACPQADAGTARSAGARDR